MQNCEGGYETIYYSLRCLQTLHLNPMCVWTSEAVEGLGTKERRALDSPTSGDQRACPGREAIIGDELRAV